MPHWQRRTRQRSTRASTALASLSVPTVAVVRGLCFGGGLELVQACDVAVADEYSAVRPQPGLTRHCLPVCRDSAPDRHVGGTTRALHALDRPYGDGRAGARPRGGCATGGLRRHRRIARGVDGTRIAALSPSALTATKSIITAIVSRAPDALEHAEQLIAASVESSDYAEGLAAFRAKRPPSF